MPDFFPNVKATVETPIKKALRDAKQAAPPPAQPQTTGKPTKALMQHSIPMGIHDVNAKVYAITDAYHGVFGYKPTPALVKDLLRADDVIQKAGVSYRQMFENPPRTPREAIVRRIAQEHVPQVGFLPDAAGPVNQGQVPGIPPFLWSDKRYIRTYGVAPESKEYKDALKYNLSISNKEGSRAASFLGPLAPIAYDALVGYFKATGRDEGDIHDSIFGLLGLTADQLSQQIEDLPAGLLNQGMAVGHDLKELTVANVSNIYNFKTGERKKPENLQTPILAEAMAKAVVEDFKDPLANPGYVLMDSWALLSAGLGTAARLNAVARARGVKGRVGALAKRPVPGSYQFGFDAYNENLRYFDNTAARIIQHRYFEHQQKKLLENQTHGLSEFDMVKKPVYDAFFSPEKKLRAATQKRMELEYAIGQSPVVEMTRLARWQRQASETMKEMLKDKQLRLNFNATRHEQREGIQRAITLLFTDDHDPIGTWRSYHQKQIETLGAKVQDLHQVEPKDLDMSPVEYKRNVRTFNYMISAHKAQLNILDMAESILENPPERLVTLYESALDVVDRMTDMQRMFVGLDNRTADQHVAAIGAQLRGEELGFERDIGKYHIPKDEQAYFDAQQTLDTALKALENERNKLTTRERNLAKPTAKGAVPFSEPPVPAGHVRLYRGEGAHGSMENLPDWIAANRGLWFSDRLGVAEKYSERAGETGKVHYIDVPEETANKLEVNKAEAGAPRMPREYVLPAELASKKIPHRKGVTRPAKAKAVEIQRLKVKQAEGELRMAQGRADAIPQPHYRPVEKQITGAEDYQVIYHGTPYSFKDFTTGESKGELSSLGPGVYFSTEKTRAAGYADKPLVGPHSHGARKDGEMAAQVHVRKVDASKLLDLLEDKEKIPAAKERIFAALSEREAEAVSSLEMNMWDRATTGSQIHASLTTAFNRLYDFQGQTYANKAIERAGFNGLKFGDEIVIFDPKAALPGFDSKALQNLRDIRQGKGSAYQPFRREIYRDENGVSRFRPRGGKYGHKPPEKPSNMKRSTGKSIEMGDMRWDTTSLLEEQYADVFRAAQGITLHRDLFRLQEEGGPATATRVHDRQVLIRDIQDAPEHLKEVAKALERKKVEPKEASLMTEEAMGDLYKFLYPTNDILDEILAEGGHVHYVDDMMISERLGFDAQKWKAIDEAMGKAMTPINEPWRLALIFATPAYILNALGSAAMLTVKQGFAAPANYGRALASTHIYGGQATRIFDVLAGNTKSMSFLDASNKFTVGSRAFMEAWQKVTDTHFRRAAVIHELRKRGVLKDSLTPDELVETLMSKDPETKRLIGEASDAARKAMLDFNNLTWPEKAIMRHVFFIYSFMRAGAVYGFHWLVEHPIQHTVLAQSGRDRKEQIERLVGKTPAWFDKQMYVPTPYGVINPVQINMPSVLTQLAYPMEAYFSDAPYASPEDMLGGSSEFLYQLVSGKDSQGKELPNTDKIPFGHGRVVGSFLALANQTPVGFAYQREHKAEDQKDLPPKPIHTSATNPIMAALAQERAALNQSPFEVDGFWNTWAPLIFRTAIPKQPNKEALAARYWRDTKVNDPDKYHKHELALVNEMVTRQGAVLGKTPSPEVRDAVKLVSEWTIYMNDWIQNHSRIENPNERMLYAETVRFLKASHRIDPKEYASLMKDVRESVDERAAKKGKLAALWNHGGSAWHEWVDQVNQVDWFATAKYKDATKILRRDGLGNFADSTKTTRDQRWEYGRKAAAYMKERAPLAADAKAETDTKLREFKLAKLRLFDNEHSDPVEINGVQFPPLTATATEGAYSRLTEGERAAWLASRAKRQFGHLTDFEKRVLTGTDPDPDAALGWAGLAKWVSDAHSTLKPGQKLPNGTTAYYADIIAKKIPAFKTEYDFANLPLATRMLAYQPIKKSTYKSEWNELLTAASRWSEKYTTAGWKRDAMTQQWEQTILPGLREWIKEQPVGFQQEVKMYKETSPRFLIQLVRP